MPLKISGLEVSKLHLQGVELSALLISEIKVFSGSIYISDLSPNAPLSELFGKFVEDAGGYYAGNMQQDDGIYALILSPKELGEIHDAKWKWDITASTGTTSRYNGWSNTIAQDNSQHPVFQWVRSLSVNGFDDWYVPAIYELELATRLLKPSTRDNLTGNRTYLGLNEDTVCRGYNPKSIPAGSCYSSSLPMKTDAELFVDGGTQSFENSNVNDDTYYWSSTEFTSAYPGYAWAIDMYSLGGWGMRKTNVDAPHHYTRAVRRVKLT